MSRKTSLIIALTLALVLSSALAAAAAPPAGKGKPDHAGPPPWAGIGMKNWLAQNEEAVAVAQEAAEVAEAEAGQEAGEEATEPVEQDELAQQIAAIYRAKPMKGNAWGFMAKQISNELGLPAVPGSVARMVKQLKDMDMSEPSDEPDEDGTDEDTLQEEVSIEVTIVSLDLEAGTIVVTYPAAEGEDAKVLELEVDAELLQQLLANDTLILTVDAEGNMTLSFPTTEDEEPVQEDDDASEVEPTEGEELGEEEEEEGIL